jgi:peptide chain release factor 2
MDNLEKFLEDLDRRRQESAAAFKIDESKREIEDLRRQMEAADFWQDRERAVAVSRRAETLQKDYRRWLDLEQSIAESRELAQMAAGENDAKLLAELSDKALLLEADLSSLENLSLYTGPYDESDALLSINAGTGGVDAQDWAQMLERMYLRFAERQAWKVEIIDRILANEAGIKSVMLKIAGTRAYGNLRSENGTHRLLRNSPFNADGLRQTSFASVEVIPEIPANDIAIKDEEVRLDVFRSSGPGGQSVNTTDSAVRLVHLPTGITVSLPLRAPLTASFHCTALINTLQWWANAKAQSKRDGEKGTSYCDYSRSCIGADWRPVRARAIFCARCRAVSCDQAD